ncbi:MAG: methionine--tRNA ligase subunit beta [Candidatus Paceibacterota bacterium]|jgi:methionyl-tRNA synthetase
MLSYDQFKQTELKVVTILEASRVEGSDKLLKLKVALGTEERQIIAGIGKAYEPENIIGRQIAIVVNLEPRSLMGLESQGMILAAHGENGEAVLLSPDKEVPAGSEIS